ncbi:MAG: M20 family metallopeptidase [Promethearchaeota archaeon]
MLSVLDITQKLVAIRSDADGGHERGVIEFIKSLLEGHGLFVMECGTSAGNGRNNLVALPLDGDPGGIDEFPDAGADGLLFCGHMDVVPPGDEASWSHDPFIPWISHDGRRLHGRGTTDMKGALAASIVAFIDNLDLIRQNAKHDRLVGLLFTVDEELALRGAEAFTASPQAKLFKKAILGEPTRLIPVKGHKGVSFARYIVSGKAVHGSIPEQGVNAIELAMELFRIIKEEHAIREKNNAHPVLGPPTLNLGKFTGGHAPNIVPDRCTFELDRRITAGEDPAELKQWYKDVVENVVVPDGASISVEMVNDRAPYLLESSDEFLRAIEGLLSPATIMNGYTEAGCYFNDAGISTVILGPGSIDQAHVVDEFILIKELERSVKIYSQIMKNYIRGTL